MPIYNQDEVHPIISDNLHPGELGAIYLALSYRFQPILLDDEEARIFARDLGLDVKGTLGIIVQLNNLMYLSADIYQLVLKRLK